MSRQPRREEYTVGWVCALPIESAAARSMLDKKYDTPNPEPGEKWDDIYFTGSIAGHNVVIACLHPGRTGTNSAATLATRMQAKFQEIRFGLMVGIGGGVPSGQTDIRLGDVVVSAPKGTFGGVVQYDMGKTTTTDIIRTGSLDAPPPILLSAVGALESDALIGESKLPNILSKTQHIPSLRRCESSTDVLYDASYNHEDDLTCGNCRSDKQVVRSQRRSGEEVIVHHGTIASGNQVMKSAAERDKISQKLGGVLCFEMEAAGLMNSFPCLVIRGISDYADSHKNDQWHGYAAATAAAYAKELLSRIPPAHVIRTARAEDVINETRKRGARSSSPTCESSKRRKTEGHSGQVPELEERGIVVLQERTRQPLNEDRFHHLEFGDSTYWALSGEQKQLLLKSLEFDQIDEWKNTIKRAHTKTCKWLLQSAPYLEWLDVTKRSEHHGFLWIKGKVGAGKSTLMKFALERAPKEVQGSLTLSFFFNARGGKMERSTAGTYRSLLLQLPTGFPQLQNVFNLLYSATAYFDANREWSVESLKVLLEEAIVMLGKAPVICFIDALDECDETEIRDMIQFFEHIGDLSTEKDFHFFTCFSSRHYPHITIRKGLGLVLEEQKGHSQDITKYIETELKIGNSKKAQQIRKDVREKAAGVFMWVVLVIRILNKESDRGRFYLLQKKLGEIPSDLHNLFRDILTRDSENKDELILCIRWILFAKEPLSPNQLYHAIRFGVNPDDIAEWNPDEIDEDSIKRFILDSSKGLAVVTGISDQKIQFIHESVRDFLLKDDGLGRIWPKYQHNFSGQSHHRLTQCSWEYITIVLDKSSDILDVIPDTSSLAMKVLRLSTEEQFPLLKYAVSSLFYHADLAKYHQISQAKFLDEFQLESWVLLDNLLDTSNIRKHQKTVSLLYILAELNCANLIKSQFPSGDALEITGERYGCPLLAAVARAHVAAVQALLSTIKPVSPGREIKHEQSSHDTITAFVFEYHENKFHYSQEHSLLWNATVICPKWVMPRLLNSSIYSYDSPPSDSGDILLEASKRHHECVVEILLHNEKILLGLEPSLKDRALHNAVAIGNLPITKLLILNGANVDARNSDKNNTIHEAVKKGFESIAMILLDKCPDLLDSTGWKECTPLLLAIQNQHVSLAKILLQKGANIHLKYAGCTDALYSASFVGNTELMKLLLDQGAEIKSQQGSGASALHGACLGGSRDAVELLLDSGADIESDVGIYGSGLQNACRRGAKKVVELLLGRGADINAKGGFHGNALHAASTHGCWKIVELLLERGADVNAKGGYYGNALQAACHRDYKHIVELLLERGVDVNVKGGYYGNALQAASVSGHGQIVELLLERGADVNAKGGPYSTALWAAMRFHHEEIKELLKEKGATLK